MKLYAILVTCLLLVGVTHSSLTSAQWPDNCSFATLATEQVSVYILPNGQGQPLVSCFNFGGILIDATITLTLRDQLMNPIVGYPAEDMWLEFDSGEIIICLAGSIADADTDVNGQTTFSGSINGGGYGDGLVVITSDYVCLQSPLNIMANSPDMNGDLAVNLTDVVLFAEIIFGQYVYAADFYWDGVINLSDIVLLGQAMSATCP